MYKIHQRFMSFQNSKTCNWFRSCTSNKDHCSSSICQLCQTISLNQHNDNIQPRQHLKQEILYKYHKHQQMCMWRRKIHKHYKCHHFHTYSQINKSILCFVCYGVQFHLNRIITSIQDCIDIRQQWN